jgi:hypothetical protein
MFRDRPVQSNMKHWRMEIERMLGVILSVLILIPAILAAFFPAQFNTLCRVGSWQALLQGAVAAALILYPSGLGLPRLNRVLRCLGIGAILFISVGLWADLGRVVKTIYALTVLGLFIVAVQSLLNRGHVSKKRRLGRGQVK